MDSLQRTFRKQYGERGIYAGSSHFRDYWARDSLFAAFGALALKDYKQVRITLDSFLDNLDASGHVPLRIGSKSQVLNYIGLPTRQGVWHNQDKGKNPSTDGNALLLIVAEKYERLSKEKLDRKKLQAALAWIERHQHGHLISDGPYSSWEDSIKLKGPRLYTNVLHYRALLSASKLFNSRIYAQQAQTTKQEILKWWNGTYFADGPHNNACLVAGNLLAVLWGVTDRQQSKRILAHIAKRDTIIPPAGFWKPTMKHAHIPFFLINLHDYHGMMEWSWLASLEIAAYRAIGRNREADRREKLLLALIDRYGGFYEVYERDRPVSRLVYRSEKDFSWALGLLIASRPSALSFRL